MKNKVIVTKTANDTELKFYLKNANGEFWLFTQPFLPEVYNWFKNGRSEREIIKFDKWNNSKKLTNTVQRIPREIKYVTKYIIPYETAV